MILFLLLFAYCLQSPKFAPPTEFNDQAALSPPDGYKDGGLQQALGGVLGNHIFGAQHLQQLQVIQRLQAQRAAMLAAQRPTTTNSNTSTSGTSKGHPIPQPPPPPTSLPPQEPAICTECAECTECAKSEHDEGKSFFLVCPFAISYFIWEQKGLSFGLNEIMR